MLLLALFSMISFRSFHLSPTPPASFWVVTWLFSSVSFLSFMSFCSFLWIKKYKNHLFCNHLFCISCAAYFLSVTKRQTIIRSNRQYLEQHMELSSNLIRRLEQVGCLTSEEASYIKRLKQNTAKNHELLNVARTMTSKKHFAFVESLHFCGQLSVATVLERGGGKDSQLLISYH